MSKLEKGIREAMIEHGIISEKYKTKITNVELKAKGSDWANVTVEVIKPRCRKTFLVWEIAVYMPKNQIWWDKSSFIYV